MQVAVVGGGLAGLTTAATLLARQEDGLPMEVTVLSPEELPATAAAVQRLRSRGNTSAVATAIWHIYLVPKEDERVLSWAAVTLEKLRSFVPDPESGTYFAHGREVFRFPRVELPTWRGIPGVNFKELDADEIRKMNEEFPSERPITWGYEIDTVVAQMDIYLPWLLGKLAHMNFESLPNRLESLEEVPGNFDVVVNCTGLGAREITPDPDVVPVRGQYLLIPRYEDTPDVYLGDDDHISGMAYAIQRGSEVCIGGTEEENVSELTFELRDLDLIDRVSDLSPWVRRDYERALREDRVTRVVGLRPKRIGGVRLEVSALRDGRPLIHNFGHGGSGFSLAWGCAHDVTALVEDTLNG